jgi:hypothetical protein
VPADDPNPPVTFLETGQSAKSRFCELEFSEAAIGDFTLPAMTGRSTLKNAAHLSVCYRVPY